MKRTREISVEGHNVSIKVKIRMETRSLTAVETDDTFFGYCDDVLAGLRNVRYGSDLRICKARIK